MKQAIKKANLIFILVIGLFFLDIHTSQAQLLIGPRIGIQASKLRYASKDFRDSVKTSPKIGYFGGLTMAIEVKERFYLQVDLLYSRKGSIVESKIDKTGEYNIHENYIEAPILYRVNFKEKIGRNRAFKWYVGAGPVISYWLSGGGSYTSSEILEEDFFTATRDLTMTFDKPEDELGPNDLLIDDPNRLQLGVNVGTGLVFDLPNTHSIAFDVRFTLGHTIRGKGDPAIIQDVYYFYDNLDSKYLALNLGLSYLFDTNISQRKKGKSTIKVR